MSLLHQWFVPVAASPEGALLPGQLVPAAVEGKSTGRRKERAQEGVFEGGMCRKLSEVQKKMVWRLVWTSLQSLFAR